MEKINSITVNGVTYEVGGAGGNANIYELPKALLSLTNDSSGAEVIEALGGDSGISAIVAAIEAKSTFYIFDNSSETKQVISVDVSCYYNYSYKILVLKYVYSKVVMSSSSSNLLDALDVCITYYELMNFLSGYSESPRYGYNNFPASFETLTASSDSDTIKNAIPFNDAVTLYNYIKKGVSPFLLKTRNECAVPVSVMVDKDDSDYFITFGAIKPGIWGTEAGGLLKVTYNSTSATYSCTVTKFSVS